MVRPTMLRMTSGGRRSTWPPESLIGMMRKFGIIELVRTGKVVMTRGNGLT